MRIALAAILAAAGAPVLACDGLLVEDAWVRLPPPGAPMAAGYGLLRNQSDAPLTIISVSSTDFGSVTLHRTVEEDGMSRMREGLPLSIPAGKDHPLEPGGYHLMLSDAAKHAKQGDQVRISFQCEAGSRSFPFAISKDAP